MPRSDIETILTIPAGKRRPVGVVWIEEADYDTLRTIMTKDDLPPTHEEWLHNTLRKEREAVGKGIRILRVRLEPESFLAWCAAQGLADIDSKARALYAAHHAAGHMRQ